MRAARAVLKRPEAGNRSLVLVNDNIGNDGIYSVQF
jgi:hypothetical protein